MKPLLFLFACFLLQPAFAQKTKQDLQRNRAAPERKAILEAMRQKLKPSLRLNPSFVVDELNMQDGFAFFQGRARRPDGGEIDFRKTAYKEDVEQGVFDGAATAALLKRKGANWVILAWVIGPTDVPWGCWWKEFRAPKAIFSYTEGCR